MNNIKVVVIGGGMAGLKAALDLAVKGAQVLLLEARSRLGGRINTIVASDGKTPLELGASYWEGYNDTPFYKHYFSNNALTPQAHVVRLDETKSELISIDDAHKEKDLVFYYQTALKLLAFAENIGIGKSFQEYIDEIDLSAYSSHQVYWIRRFLENCLQHHCTSLSLGGFPTFNRDKGDHNEAWNTADADFCFVQNGYNSVIQQIAKECEQAGVSLYLNSQVIKIIDLGNNGVQVQTQHTTFKCDKVISTIPIGVLKNKAQSLFEPSLSQEKMLAINTIGIHDATKVILEFENEPFWDNPEGPYIYLDSKQLNCLLEIRNAYPLCGKAILLTGKYSDLARTLYLQYPADRFRAESELVSKMMSDLRKAYPTKNIPDPIKTIVYCWTHDPYAQGAYPYRKANMTEQMQIALERSEGNIYFAGADFSRLGFSVHNAYINGMHAAQKLIDEVGWAKSACPPS